MKVSCEHAMCLLKLHSLLLLLLETLKFWTCVRVESKENYQSQIDEHANNMNLFYECGSKSMLTDTATGDGETFCCGHNHMSCWA